MSELRTPDELTVALAKLIDVARVEFGETEWRYEKKHVTWSKFRRQRGNHYTPIGDGTEVTKEEYDAHIVESDRLRVEAFMGRLPCSYMTYDKKIRKPGWRERLIELLKTAEPQS